MATESGSAASAAGRASMTGENGENLDVNGEQSKDGNAGGVETTWS